MQVVVCLVALLPNQAVELISSLTEVALTESLEPAEASQTLPAKVAWEVALKVQAQFQMVVQEEFLEGSQEGSQEVSQVVSQVESQASLLVESQDLQEEFLAMVRALVLARAQA